MKILHLSDIHMGSGFAHGRIDPETGQNTRLQDFTKSLSRAIDRAISEPVDLVLFGGDAFPDATPAPYIQQAFAGAILSPRRCEYSRRLTSWQPRSTRSGARWR